MTPDIAAIRAALAAATPRHPDIENADYDRLLSNAPSWLAALCDENERLRADTQELNAGWTECAVERDAALADLKTQAESWAKDIQTAREWRACADQLDEALREALSYVPKHFCLKHSIGVEALAVYERLLEKAHLDHGPMKYRITRVSDPDGDSIELFLTMESVPDGTPLPSSALKEFLDRLGDEFIFTQVDS